MEVSRRFRSLTDSTVKDLDYAMEEVVGWPIRDWYSTVIDSDCQQPSS